MWSTVDGLIGMDVFSRFLITLDYPDRKLLLAPLPLRPDETAAKPTLETDSNQEDDDSPRQPTNKNPSCQNLPERPARPLYRAGDEGLDPVYRIGHNLLFRRRSITPSQKMFVLDTGAFSYYHLA